MSPQAAGRKVLTVTQLNESIHDLLERSYADVWVEGEVSDPRTFPSGHTYFSLKDEGSCLSAVLFKGSAARVKFTLEHGLGVLARGRVSSYVKRGQYQLIVSELEPRSAGALQLAFEQLKAKLAAEGLFDPARKRPLPPFPRRVGIVTSLQGAAIRDMLSVLKRRFDGLHIRVYPVQVQGAGAAAQIAGAVEDFNASFPDVDVLLVGRGGGSLEDLWAFNEEPVARAIAASRIPVVSCVGHETDFTIADFAADLRAPTPSAAAELVVRERAAVLERLGALKRRLLGAVAGELRVLKERLARLAGSPFLRDPRRIFEQKAQRIDELSGRLAPALRELTRRAEERLAAARRLAPALRGRTRVAELELKRQAGRLEALSPLKVLSRGYSIAFDDTGRALRSARRAKAGDKIRLRLHEGELGAQVTEVKP